MQQGSTRALALSTSSSSLLREAPLADARRLPVATIVLMSDSALTPPPSLAFQSLT